MLEVFRQGSVACSHRAVEVSGIIEIDRQLINSPSLGDMTGQEAIRNEGRLQLVISSDSPAHQKPDM
jgi:hypothetical protein